MANLKSKFWNATVFATLIALLFLLNFTTNDDNYIRLHIIANSDSYTDQILKENIRDELMKTVGKEFASEDSFYSVRSKIIKNLGRIEDISKKVSRDSGFKYDVVVKFGEYEFPSIQYKNLVLPAGRYQALRVMIGEGAGSNWWCVMYPPLCITDLARGSIVRNTGNTNQASIRADEQTPVEHRLRVAEWLRRSRSRLRRLFSSAERTR